MLTFASAVFLIGCPSVNQDKKPEEIEGDLEQNKEEGENTQSSYMSIPEDRPTSQASHVERHPRDAFDWSKAVHDPYADRPKFTRNMQRRTQEIHDVVTKYISASKDANSLIRLVSLREISHHGSQRPFDGRGIVHRLNADKEGAISSWYKTSKIYSKKNPLYIDSRIWMSYGPQGMNSPLFLHIWDVEGDPRMLGDTVIGDLTYLRAARSNLRKLSSDKGIRCWKYDDEGQVREYYDVQSGKIKTKLRSKVARDEEGNVITHTVQKCGPESFADIDGDGRLEIVHKNKNGKLVLGPDYTCVAPTWEYVHRATSGGKICPPWPNDSGAIWYMNQFRRRADRVGLDPYEVVSSGDLGAEPSGGQYEMWVKIWTKSLWIGPPKRSCLTQRLKVRKGKRFELRITPSSVFRQRSRAPPKLRGRQEASRKALGWVYR